jgi:hypothetical protein
MGFLGIIGFIISLVAGVTMLIGLIPFMGWFNWFTTLPLAIGGAIISGLGSTKGRRGFATAGLVISLVVLIIAIGRLVIGCGIF